MLLPALVRRRALCRACADLPSWGAIAGAARAALESFGAPNAASGAPSFPPEIHRFITEALCRAAEGVADVRALEAYVARALAAPGEALAWCAANPENMKHPAGEARAVATLEALRGAAPRRARSVRSSISFSATSNTSWRCSASAPRARR